MKGYLLVLSLLMTINAHAGEVYRSIDDSGKVHYGDAPLQGSEDVEELKIRNVPVADADLPYETRQAQKNFPVTLYSFSNCGPVCDQARDLLDKRGIPYTDKVLVQQEDIDAFGKDSGDIRVPAASIGKTWIKGFLAEKWNNALDAAGYPKKNLAYRPPKPVTPAASQPAATPAAQ